MRVLITGADGQLGHTLRADTPAGVQVIPASRKTQSPGASDRHQWLMLDFSDLPSLVPALDRLRPEMIINAAAYTAVDQAELEPQLAWQVNAEAPGVLARWCAHNGARMVQISTDYVFDGQATQPYSETAATRPLGVYGASKLAGETATMAAGCEALILRTSWLYSHRQQNFLTTMVRLARSGKPLQVVNDQLGRPTSAASLAAAIWQLVGDWPKNVAADTAQLFHVCDADIRSWYDFADSLFRQALALGVIDEFPDLKAVSSEAFPTRAQRPAYSVLDCSKLATATRWRPVPLAQALDRCLLQMRGTDAENLEDD